MTLQRFTRNGSDAGDLMDDEQYNPPRLIRHASWLFLLEVRGDSLPMIVKPGGHHNHVKSARVANGRALPPFVQDEVLLSAKIQHD